MHPPDQLHYGILATHCYLPRLRLDRAAIYAQHRWMAPSLKGLAKGARSIANWDEDSVTMGFEAVRPLRHIPIGTAIPELTMVTTTAPFAERSNASIVAAALGLPSQTCTRDMGCSPRAALAQLATQLKGQNDSVHYLVAAERRLAKPASAQEMQQGDGAAAALIGSGKPLATFVAHHGVYANMVHRFRGSGETYDYGWEERWVRDEGFMKLMVPTIRECLKNAGVTADQIKHFAVPAVLGRIDQTVAKAIGIDASAIVPSSGYGELGTAEPIALLDAALRRAEAGDFVLVAAFGSGCDALLLKRTEIPCEIRASTAGKEETSYLKYLSFTGQLELDWGMRAEMDNKTAFTAAWRDDGAIMHFEAGQCELCGTVQFPPSRVCVNPVCHAQDSQHPKSLADVGAKVLSHTSDWLGYTPAPPFQFGHIDFDGGGRVLMEFCDTDADELRVGLPVRMMLRIKDFDAKRGNRRYFWKATAVRDNNQGVQGG